MNRIKIGVVVVIFALVGITMIGSDDFSATAAGDPHIDEITGYKSWTKITKHPIRSLQIDGASGDENVFIVDGQEVTNFRTGQLNG